MKKFIVLLLILLFASFANAANVYYCSADGDNSDGLSWATAKNYISQTTEIGAFVNGDTIVVGKGCFGGIMVHRAICVDSAMYASGGYERAVTDTTKLWGGSILSTNGNLTFTAEGAKSKFYGIFFHKNASYAVLSAGVESYYYQCKFRCTATSNQMIDCGTFSSADSIYFANCLFLVNSNIDAIRAKFSSTLALVNCTFYGQLSQIATLYTAPGTASTYVHNCIFHDTGSGQMIQKGTSGGTHSWDYNIWYADGTTKWSWVGTEYTTFAGWQGALQGEDVNNEVNSGVQDPALLYKGTTCVPSVPVSGSDLGYGTTTGWYQTGAGGHKNIIIIH